VIVSDNQDFPFSPDELVELLEASVVICAVLTHDAGALSRR
jgi:hypothetical protein